MDNNVVEIYGITYKVENSILAEQVKNLYAEANRKQIEANNLDKEIKELHRQIREILYNPHN
jgi:hypothetical protein